MSPSNIAHITHPGSHCVICALYQPLHRKQIVTFVLQVHQANALMFKPQLTEMTHLHYTICFYNFA